MERDPDWLFSAPARLPEDSGVLRAPDSRAEGRCEARSRAGQNHPAEEPAPSTGAQIGRVNLIGVHRCLQKRVVHEGPPFIP